jgi:hypothetical protein
MRAIPRKAPEFGSFGNRFYLRSKNKPMMASERYIVRRGQYQVF